MLNFKDSFFAKLFDAIDNNSILIAIDENNKYLPIWCSREYAEMMEGSIDEVIAYEIKTQFNTIHPDDRDKVAYIFEHHNTIDRKNSFMIRKITSKGNVLCLNIYYAPVNEDGRQYLYLNCTDVTDIKVSQQQTIEMYEELNRELEALSGQSLAVLRCNLTKGIVERVSGTDLYDVDRNGASIKDMMKARLDSMPFVSDREAYNNHFSFEMRQEKFHRGEDPEPLVVMSERQSGKRCFVKFSVLLRKNPLTGDLMAIGIETEYNNEKVSEVLNEKVLANQYDMVCYILDGKYGVSIGDASKIKRGSIFPKERDGDYMEYVRGQVLPCIPENERESAQEALDLKTVDEQLMQKDQYSVDISCLIDGEPYFKRFVFYSIDREKKFYILMKEDMTDVIMEQQEKNQLLADALDEAERASYAKTAFLSTMSHEIRTPMNAIIGLDSIALQEPDISDNTRECLEKIGESADHLLRLINDILDMSRIESGRMIIRREEFSFADMIAQINIMIGGQCREKNISYDCRILNNVDHYYIGDNMKLKQIILNILGNAVKFTPEGGEIVFTVEKSAEYENQVAIRFVMKDTGIGIDKDFIPKIFDAFAQEDVNKANKFGSTGLGMAITKNIVEMMNGHINVDSTKGKGTTFTVDVTLGKSDHDNDHDLHDDINTNEINVLVIDDDPVDCAHAKSALENIGITPDICLSGKEAFEKVEVRMARHEAYDFILVDWKMPDQDGVEVTRQIRKLVGHESLVIVLTAYNWDDIESEAREVGVDHFLTKPLFSDQVMKAYKKAKDSKIPLQKEKALARLKGRRVLLAEDMKINAEIMKRLLKTKEVEVELAENGQIAVDMFRESKDHYYDAILMDIRMPVLDGLGATKAIRALSRPDAKEIPIIAMTANAFDEDVQRSLQAGMNAHLSKPVEQDKLFMTLSELIKWRIKEGERHGEGYKNAGTGSAKSHHQ
ncbi:MAG: response regulator [Butyrivibrio sp.]|nr:response regulator [Butyrivibrio sp.]